MVAKRTVRCERAGWGEYCPLSEPIRSQDLEPAHELRKKNKETVTGEEILK